ncbi:MAG: signal peptidase II [Planctomycetota bacterium]|nr:signal peptidase II [Planctomycetota bacterium]
MSSSPGITSPTDSTEKSPKDVAVPGNRYVLFFCLMIMGAGLDLWTKSYAFANYYSPELAVQGFPQTPHWWVEGIFGLQTSHNPGALFGLGAGYSWVFAAISIGALIGIACWMFVWRAGCDRWLTVALGLVSGGIIGNLYDRVGWGYIQGFPEAVRDNVRDWILFRLEGVPFFDPWPNFNIADSLLVVGAILLFLHALCSQVPESAEPSPNSGDEEPTAQV